MNGCNIQTQENNMKAALLLLLLLLFLPLPCRLLPLLEEAAGFRCGHLDSVSAKVSKQSTKQRRVQRHPDVASSANKAAT